RLRRINLPYCARQSPAQPQNGNCQTLRSCQRVRAITQALDCRTYDRLAEPLPPTGQGLREPQSQRSGFPQTRFHPPHVAKGMQSLMKSPDGLSDSPDQKGYWPFVVNIIMSASLVKFILFLQILLIYLKHASYTVFYDHIYCTVNTLHLHIACDRRSDCRC